MIYRFLCAFIAAAAGISAQAQELLPARSALDDRAINEAWSQAWDDHLHSGKRVPFTPPSLSDIPEGEFGEMVKDGMQAFMYPALYASDYVGNELACTNCHLDIGRRAGAAPMWGAYPLYPKYRGKNKQVNTMEMRIQGCFRYSMNGTPPPADGDLMKSFLAYFSWLSQSAPIGAKLEGAGFYSLPDPEQEPDITRGAEVYAQWCATCHGQNGEGERHVDTVGWVFPPLWGAESYNWGAGMHQPGKASAFIKKNMPYGLQNVLSDQEAWDVAMFINSHERPQDPRFTGDVAETAERFHTSPYNLYGTVVNGAVLGANAYPAGRAPAN
ncbi:MAG: c-type cytochrome [Mangrovicoccus sp.]|nr:c-type cytochrome [Mangrovicoccus sp.]